MPMVGMSNVAGSVRKKVAVGKLLRVAWTPMAAANKMRSDVRKVLKKTKKRR